VRTACPSSVRARKATDGRLADCAWATNWSINSWAFFDSLAWLAASMAARTSIDCRFSMATTLDQNPGGDFDLSG